jgi:hypothetical protein
MTVTQKDWIDILLAMLTPTIAILGIYIAYQQMRTNQRNQETNSKRLKHELYEKRFDIYIEAATLLSNIVLLGGNVTDNMLIKYWTSINASRFLLSEELTNYLKELGNKAENLKTKIIEGQEADNRTHCTKERSELQKWFHAQIGVLNEKFDNFLKLDD